MQNPKFVEIVGIPAMFASEMNEAKDDPERMQLLQTFLKGWMEVVVQPAMLEQQAQMGQMQMQTQQMQMQQAQQNAPTSAQSFAESGQGPGSQSGQQGGPRGATGPRSGGQG
jgi:predicted ATP-grasp superfamily ATP-dependent carboligase